jgi:hypothetical protein
MRVPNPGPSRSRGAVSMIAAASSMVFVGLLSGCGAAHPAPAADRPDRPAVSAAMLPADLSAAVPSAVLLPDPDAALHTLAKIAPRTGGSALHTVQARPGQFWINVNCRGAGSVSVEFRPLDRFTVDCGARVQVTRNQINLVRAHRLQLRVSAPAGVEWAMLVQQ